MGLSRRMFTKEFKLVAAQRVERGSSIGEVTRTLDVNPNVLHRWRREVRQGPGNVFPETNPALSRRWPIDACAQRSKNYATHSALRRKSTESIADSSRWHWKSCS